jgi:CRISPR-associated endonuclease/helicase Cas3
VPRGRGELIDARLWGKSHGLVRPYPVVGHLVDTAVVAGAVWDGVLGPGRRGELAGALGVPVGEAPRG